ncbi:MAG: hypothetical protein AUK63_199 [bacterium P3]|nr:MAG: hypothetical protein AUK63_199 [bacterium P3]KWW42339.1 MAG: hypothetical protein F083_243 [bacterium F083]
MHADKLIQLLTIIGTRPQIIKSAAVSRVIRKDFSNQMEEWVVHTGQHYDNTLSQVFFDELDIPMPRYNLAAGSDSGSRQTAKMIAGLDAVMTEKQFDGVLLYGDTNSTLAGAIAAAQHGLPVFHVEAGLRSFDRTMPEEMNRIVCDHLSNICFAPTNNAYEQLVQEGLDDSRPHFADNRKRELVESGDVMYDNCLYYAEKRSDPVRMLHQLQLQTDGYVLATIHRKNNTDCPDRLEQILLALSDIARDRHLPVVLPLHPRTRKAMEKLPHCSTMHLQMLPPAGYLAMAELERNARVVITDSGGVQKEAFFYERPCVILRSETEWTEIVHHGAGILADADRMRIVDAYDAITGRAIHFPPLFGDGHAAENIVRHIVQYITGDNN